MCIRDSVYSEESQDKIKTLIDFCISNDASFTISNNDANESLVINNTSDLESLINGNCDSSVGLPTVTNNGDEVISSTSLNVSPFYSLNIFVKQFLNPYSISNVTSNISGLTLGINCLLYTSRCV